MKITTVNNINAKATIAFFLTMLLIVFIAFIFKYNFASAGAGESVRGFAWGGTESLGGYQGFGWISLNNITDGASVNYVVNVPASDGNLSGYAWSEHYGWISFNGADLAGCAPALTQAKVTGSTVTGGARVIATRDAAGNSGGFDGCISLSGSNYGVTAVNSGSGYKLLQGYVWSSDLGWIDFNISGSPVPVSVASPTGFVAAAGLCDTGTINLIWNAVAGATGYILKDGATTIYTGPLTLFSHNTVANDGVLHNYTVMATVGADNSALATASVNAPVSCTAVPTVPTITATPGACGTGVINVSWSSSGAIGYILNDGATPIYTGPLTSFSHIGLSAGITHNYSVTATNLNGSAVSGVVNTAPVACGALAPSGSITASSCIIPAGSSSCPSTVSWSSSNFVGANALVEQNGSFVSNLFSDSVSKPVNPDNDDFRLEDTGSAFIALASANPVCDATSGWNGSTCVVASIPPIINSVTATPKLIRAGQTSTITAVVTASEASTCEFIGAKLTVETRSYPAGSVQVPKSVVTRPLTSTQIVEVECYSDSDPSNKVIATPVRVDVVPTVQEI